jgi:hypothetical protein
VVKSVTFFGAEMNDYKAKRHLTSEVLKESLRNFHDHIHDKDDSCSFTCSL